MFVGQQQKCCNQAGAKLSNIQTCGHSERFDSIGCRLSFLNNDNSSTGKSDEEYLSHCIGFTRSARGLEVPMMIKMIIVIIIWLMTNNDIDVRNKNHQLRDSGVVVLRPVLF